jgi:S-adenosylmethionine hydrolase
MPNSLYISEGIVLADHGQIVSLYGYPSLPRVYSCPSGESFSFDSLNLNCWFFRRDTVNLRPQFLTISLLLAVLFGVACSQAPQRNSSTNAQPSSAPRPTIVFMTDFGTANDAVAICRALIFSIAPDVRLTDITHQVTPFSIEEASRFLYGVTPYYPAGTIFLVVVDPGVGTTRKAITVKSKKGQYFVLPDNGLATPVLDRDGLDSAREITNQNWMIQAPLSSTFHGRDIFSPVAAHLAAGWDFNLVGPAVPQLVRLTIKSSNTTNKGIEGDIIGLDDPFGSLITDIPADDFKSLGYNLADRVTVQINKGPVTLAYVRTFMDVPAGEPLLYIDSRGRVGIAINQGNYSKKFNIEPPASIFIPRKHASVVTGTNRRRR